VNGPTITRGYAPDAIDRVVAMHGVYYREHWGFGPYFETKVARELGEFFARYDSERDGLWMLTAGGVVHGAIAIDGLHADTDGAHLRWFIVSDDWRGQGAGRALLGSAMDFCRACGYTRVYLWTFAGLDPARHLYEDAGFRLAEEARGTTWGTEVTEQRFVCALAPRDGR